MQLPGWQVDLLRARLSRQQTHPRWQLRRGEWAMQLRDCWRVPLHRRRLVLQLTSAWGPQVTAPVRLGRRAVQRRKRELFVGRAELGGCQTRGLFAGSTQQVALQKI